MSGGWLSGTSLSPLPLSMQNHNELGDNVGFLDGHVRFVTNQEMYRRQIATSLPTDTGGADGEGDPWGVHYRRILNNP